MEHILKYFPELTPDQIKRFDALQGLYTEWNERINVISRKDIDQLYLHHVLHSLAIAKVCSFDNGARVMDVGCGGGFPGIPLAIMFPQVRFIMVDSIGKKIKVVEAIAEELGLSNIEAHHSRVEAIDGKFDYIVSRAVTEMKTFVDWTWNKIQVGKKGSLPNGILCLKGGELAEELALSGKKCNLYPILSVFKEDFFETKQIVYIRK